MNKYILLFLFFIAPNFVADSYGQEVLDSASLSLQRSFRNLGDALLQPDSVFKMDLSRQKRKVVPEEVRKFRNLQVLKLSRNNLREIPEWIGELKNLQVLDLGYNKLKALPPVLVTANNWCFLV
jgi:Leucine-rich repeat (LRR) protein